ncbi:hypothetical protein BDW02DRAFT_651485 [Decorospora gaudefroyi]|uniref:Uncharacterized protein n=1 Tax=Decorospora gaudefroyi TaxID=184978 RepID=A0A6A5JYL3_9PLEO|nr:hypothetical protein BDW02DRAFT_651485 [Decorospora gaudefroyi]
MHQIIIQNTNSTAGYSRTSCSTSAVTQTTPVNMTSDQPEPIAIVGSACRFPGNAISPSALWELLESPRDVCAEIPADRFDTTGYYHPDGSHHGTTNVLKSYLLQEDLRVFDAAFFNISPNEADSMDPQQRLLLETVYEALEAGGHTMESLRGSDTAVFTGTMGVDYNDTGVRDLNTVPTYFATGVNRAIISNRVSYFFDWHGPSMTIDTACSSSLVAVHQSVKALRTGESRVALACGTQVILNPEMYVVESKLKMLSPTGRSRMWDAAADGYARGEGVAAVVLKRLSDAIADGDHIECLIRETGTNQDGHSNGITVPSTEAQAALIRQTYARAGLDPVNRPEDRPQFFEAHGTGTKAGDPKEAAAIYQSFGRYKSPTDAPLYVGSVKTVIGHLEGSAGLAGLLKGSTSIQNGTIPPNLLFSSLNPDIEPFYKGLRVPTEVTPWPELPKGVPRRVSVNSFGFGGSNAHAILEQYCESSSIDQNAEQSPVFTPFVFSALSESSLVAQMQAYREYLKTNPNLNASDLAWTLQSRRSQLSTRVFFSASDIEQLQSKIETKLAPLQQNPKIAIGTRSSIKPNHPTPKILGIFTGQGAQWAGMGAELIRSSKYVVKRLQELDQSLATLPPSDRPTWRLQDELAAVDGASRISEAALSQPLCTAIQVVLIDLLKKAGIEFSAVVGHSSGEIAAAYTAGFISAEDSVRIAYYRGLHASLAGNAATGQKGAMLAVGTSWEDAQDLINLRTFRGRLAIAAHNSSASVTLSGDVDAIISAKKIFDEEKKFARVLKVDTAYHSHHMLPCGDAYISSLQGCEIKINPKANNASCQWFSSVSPNDKGMDVNDSLKDVYWRNNMTGAVLFADAVRNAVSSDDQITIALEVGPHPALKGPAVQNIADVRSTAISYSGMLSRGQNDVHAVSDALGFLWTHLGAQSVDLQSYTRAIHGDDFNKPKLAVGLPSYQWNHARSHWTESRRSRKLRSRKQPMHEILGMLLPESNAHDLRWSNVLKVSEVPWLDGHQLQGQTVFPAAGYVAMALEASKHLAGSDEVEVFEVRDLSIPRAITFEEGDTAGVETLVTLTEIRRHPNSTATANYCCYSLPVLTTGSEQEMDLIATATVKINFGASTPGALAAPALEDYRMYPINTDRFYSTLDQLGYGYSGPFRTLSSMQRRLGYATAEVRSYAYTDADPAPYLVHPSTLDVAFQASMLAYSAPGDDRLWSLHVPTAIRSLRVNPAVCSSLPTSGAQVPVRAAIDSGEDTFSGYMDLLSQDGQHSMVQIEELTIKTFAPATEADDRVVFTYTKLDSALPDGAAVAQGIKPTAFEVELAHACERIAYYYIRHWNAELSEEEWANGQPHYKYLHDWVNRTLDLANKGTHKTLKRQWAKDTREDIDVIISKFADNLDVKMIQTVGDKIPSAVRGETTILEHLLRDNMLDDFYQLGSGFQRYNQFLASMMKQITHRYPHTKILEIGAGTGGATKYVLNEMGDKMSSYTYTDISVGFFAKAAEIFKQWSDRITFKVFDAEKNPLAQGYEPNSYDIVIASNVLHATETLHTTLSNTRKLLKPGGHLMLLEITNNEPIRTGLIWGTLAGWWAGVKDGRRWAPTITPGMWHSALRKAGFSGVDAVTPEIDGIAWPFSIMAAQAVDDRVQFLRQPLNVSKPPIHIDSLVILGNQSLETAKISEELSHSLRNFCGEVTILDTLPTEEDALDIPPMSTFINLVDIDAPIFESISEGTLEGMKRMFELAKQVLWVTNGAMVDRPYHMASITFSRVIRREAGHVSLNHLDISDITHNNVTNAIATHLLQLCALDEWDTPAGDGQQLLWSREPEAFLDNGKLLLPRLVSNVEQNRRLNSFRRQITKEVPVASANFIISPPTDASPASLSEPSSLSLHKNGTDFVTAKYSTLMAINVLPDTFLYIVGSEDAETGQTVLSISTTNALRISPVVSIKSDAGPFGNFSLGGLITTAASEFAADSILSGVPAGHRLLVYCSEQDAPHVSALLSQAAEKSVTLTITYDSGLGSDHVDPLWTKLSIRDSKFAVKKLMQSVKPTFFLNLSEESALGNRVRESLPSGCKTIDISSIVQSKASLPTHVESQSLEARLQAMAKRLAVSTTRNNHHLILEATASDKITSRNISNVVQWPSSGSVNIGIRPLEAVGFFSKDKTYLLVGLSAGIGQSITEWMISNGAGCVCLTSRRPAIDERWLKSVQRNGSTVKVYAMDVTDMHNTEEVIAEIRATCPPIAGVANGAMVLHDSLFSKMSLDKMQGVLGPKIDGSNNLDRIFYDDDLDFFILFSSAACVVGNVGQSNYTAANGYINSLVRQRRRRGVAGSTFDIGLVAGIGYIETAGQVVMDQLTSLGLRPVSETDLRQAFAETIQTGRPKSGDENSMPDAVITTGIRHFSVDENIKGPWFTNTFFSHCVIDSKAEEAQTNDQDQKSNIPAARQLVKATTHEQALDILQECFAAKLRVVLQLSNQAIDYAAPLVDLGIDSLVAVEVRSWFLKEIKVDIPVLKVVGGASSSELCQQAMKKIPDELLTGIGKEAEPNKPVGPEPQKKRPEPAPPSPQISIPSSDSASENSDSLIDTPGSALSSDVTSFAATPQPSTKSDYLTAGSSASVKVSPPSYSSHVPPIVARRKQRFVKSVPISLGQSRFWFLQQLLADQRTHNVAYYYRIKGDLNVGDLERAVRVVASRHEALRTCFIPDEEDASCAYQKVLPSSPIRLQYKTISHEEDVAVEYAKLRTHDFDMASGELLRLVLLTLSASSHYLLVYHHHIIIDGISLQVFLSDLEKAYNGTSLGPAPLQYPDFSVTQQKAVEDGDMDKELRFWRGIFPAGEEAPVLPLLPMARGHSRVPMAKYDTYQVQRRITPELAARIKSVSKAQRSSPFHVYLAAFKTLLFRFTETEDLAIGVADGARNDSRMMSSIGFYLNLLTLRFARNNTQSFSDALVEARKVSHAALENSRLPFDVLLTELNIPRSSTHSPLFQAFLDYRQGLQERQQFGNCQMEMSEEVHTGKTAYDLTVDVTTNDTDAVIMFRAQKSIYDMTATEMLCETYVHFLDTLTTDPSLLIDQVPLFGAKQLQDAVRIGRGPDMVSDWPDTLPHRIDQVAQTNPEAVALLDGNSKPLTYSAMIKRIEAIAESLHNAGIIAGQRVLVFQDASADWPCSMFAIMRLGAIYIPLDLRNPLPRLASVAQDSEPAAILVDSTTVDDCSALGVPSAYVINVANVASVPSSTIANKAKGGSPAAILYTSGSTGAPKGIMVTHAGLRNEIEGYTKTWKLGAERVLQQSAFTFNHSSDQMYTGLVNGGMVYVVPWEKRGNALEITKIIQEHGITYTKATPSEYSLWIQYGGESLRQASAWRFAFGGGESLTTSVTQEFAALNLPGLRFFNSYGPTEISISSTKIEIPYREREALDSMGRIPCGYSLPNYFTYVVDENLNALPVGMPGQIALGGAGVSLGYTKNEELTKKHFVANPFASSKDIANGWSRMYLTGDIGHLNQDGAIVFRSRMMGDSQVKIRGIRVELSDIESNIVTAASGTLRDAVVTLRDLDGDFLVAHVVFAPNNAVSDKTSYLKQLLSGLPIPQYMIPVVAVPLDELPLTNHSKVDRKAIATLALPQQIRNVNEDADELTVTMLQLRSTWKEVLGKGIGMLGLGIQPSTSFFLVGGNSLLIIRLQSQIRDKFGVAISLVDLLGANTLGEMARKIEEHASVRLIDWEEETEPPVVPEYLKDVSLGPKSEDGKGKTLLVTGATGFLSRALLPHLAARPDVREIHCVGVRDMERLYSSDKVVAYTGDLTSPLMGLSEKEFRRFAQDVDVILHMGAARSFWDSYHVLRAVNVLPTKILAQLAAPRRIPIHYFSTSAVFEGSTPDLSSAAAHVPSVDGSSGYKASRWASERVLERSGTSLGIPSFVYRFLPASQQLPATEAVMDEFLRCADISNSVPDTRGWAGRLDVIPTDVVAGMLCESLLEGSALSTETHFQHIEARVTVTGEELATHMEQQRGNKTGMTRIPLLKWIGRIKKAGFAYLLASHEARIERGTDDQREILQTWR